MPTERTTTTAAASLWRLVPPVRQPVRNDAWDAVTMLRLAQAGAYPSAPRGSATRAEEIAYWQGRCGAEGLGDEPEEGR